jgi:hypothetical protein
MAQARWVMRLQLLISVRVALQNKLQLALHIRAQCSITTRLSAGGSAQMVDLVMERQHRLVARVVKWVMR